MNLLNLKKSKLESVIIIFSNLILIYNTLFLGWSVFEIILAFVIESFIFCFFTALKMLFTKDSLIVKLFFIFILVLMFFVFTTVNLNFVAGLMIPVGYSSSAVDAELNFIMQSLDNLFLNSPIFILAFILSYAFSLFTFIKQEADKTSAKQILGEALPRTAVMTVTATIGGLFLILLRLPIIIIILFVIMKTFYDLGLITSYSTKKLGLEAFK